MGEFYRLITDTTGASAADPEKKGKAEGHLKKIQALLSRYSAISETVSNFNSLNDVFNNIDTIIAGILDEVSDGAFLGRIASLK